MTSTPTSKRPAWQLAGAELRSPQQILSNRRKNYKSFHRFFLQKVAKNMKFRTAPIASVELLGFTRGRRRSGKRIPRQFSSMLETSIRFQICLFFWHFLIAGHGLVHEVEVRSDGGVRQPAQLHGHGSWKPWLWWLCGWPCAFRRAGRGLWKSWANIFIAKSRSTFRCLEPTSTPACPASQRPTTTTRWN